MSPNILLEPDAENGAAQPARWAAERRSDECECEEDKGTD